MSLLDARALQQVRGLVESLELRLQGMVVATEAGSGPFLYSSLVALAAGADKVLVVAPDSSYGSHEGISSEVFSRAASWKLPTERLMLVPSRDALPDGIDIFLNLGFLRPLDTFLLEKASDRAVISYMCESWEVRPGDLDFDYCARRNLPVAGVDEDFDGAAVFESCGQLALKMLFEAGVEVRNCRVAVLSDDPFGDVIERALSVNGAAVDRVAPGKAVSHEVLASLDALVLATYSGDRDVLASAGLSPQLIAGINPDLCILQFAGSVDFAACMAHGLNCYPAIDLPPFRMARTLAYLGKRPVISLHALGLKVAELLYRRKNEGAGLGRFAGLVQEFGGAACAS